MIRTWNCSNLILKYEAEVQIMKDFIIREALKKRTIESLTAVIPTLDPPPYL